MNILTAILVALVGLTTSNCDTGKKPLEFMQETPSEKEEPAFGADDPSSAKHDFQDNSIQDNEQDEIEAKIRDDFSGAQKLELNNSIQAHGEWNKERESFPSMLAYLQISAQSTTPKAHSDPKLFPVLDSLDTLVPGSDGYYIRHEHLNTSVVIKVERRLPEFILPITSTTLIGQELLWKHRNEEIIDEYVGVEFYPPIIQDFVGIFVQKKINGVLNRLMVFSYSSQGVEYSYEPDRIYVESNVEKLYDNTRSNQMGTSNNLGVKHLLYEVKRFDIDLRKLYLNVVVVADSSAFKRFKNVTSIQSTEETVSRASSYLMELEEMFRLTPLVVTENHVLYGTVSEVQVCTSSQETSFIQRTTSSIGIIDGQEALRLYKIMKPRQTQLTNPNYVVVVLTSNNIRDDGLIVSGVHSNGFSCQGSIIILTHEELHGTEKKIVAHIDGMLKEAEKVEADSLDNILDKLRIGRDSCLGNEAVQTREGLGPQEMDVHLQCKMAFGNDFVACRKSQGMLCTFLACRLVTDKEEAQCISLPNMKGLPRTPCEDGKYCKRELCSSDAAAPSMFEWPSERQVPGSPSCPEDKLTVIILGLTIVLILMVAVLCALVCRNFVMSKEANRKTDK